MANFKDLKNSTVGIAASYTGGVKVYVESTGDEYIFKQKWFPDLLGALSIEAVSDKDGANGGCRAVIEKVANARADGLKAFGIVDRDSLLSDATYRDSLFWEADDEIFVAAEPFGAYIHVLLRWEIENYLLKPRAVFELLRDKALQTVPLGTGDLLQNEEDLVLRTTIDVINVPRGQRCPSEKFADRDTGDDLKRKVLEYLRITETELGAARQQIANFFNGETDHETRWDRICRIVNGKRALHQLGHFLSRKDRRWSELRLEESEKGALATHVANLKLIDPELKSKMATFAAAAR
ncbi:hypothetical protein [Paraburkholderia fungorum]